MSEPFLGARLKVKRAQQHINDLNRIIRDFIEGKTYEVFVEHDPHGGDDVLKVKATALLPDDFVLVLGDAVHNLRVSLDYVINDIVFLTVNERSKYTKFPFHPTRDALINAINGGLKEKAPKMVIECIEDIIQPYPGGDGHALVGLHDIDIEDKHRLLIAKSELNFIDGICIEDDEGVEREVDRWLVVNDLVASYPVRSKNSKVKDQGKSSYNIVFADSSIFALKPVVETMHYLTKIVSRAIDELERAFRLSQI